MIHIITSSRYKIDKKLIKPLVEEYCAKRGFEIEGYINIVFVGTRRMRQVARDYLKIDRAKPVLTFKYGKDEETFGEIFICYPYMVLLAAEKDKTILQMEKDLIEHGLENLFTKND